jgi:folate-binding Fe-S cluster repair protein YgfZ
MAKGCYTGQEALLRLMTYGSVRRRLVLLRGAAPVPVAPAEIASGGETVGRLTSVAPADGGWVGLAVLRHEAIGSQATLSVSGAGAIGAIEPFPETRPLGLL